MFKNLFATFASLAIQALVSGAFGSKTTATAAHVTAQVTATAQKAEPVIDAVGSALQSVHDIVSAFPDGHTKDAALSTLQKAATDIAVASAAAHAIENYGSAASGVLSPGGNTTVNIITGGPANADTIAAGLASAPVTP